MWHGPSAVLWCKPAGRAECQGAKLIVSAVSDAQREQLLAAYSL
jgi:hypothetical protein